MNTVSPPPLGASIMEGYAGLGSVFDEMTTPAGDLRSHWTEFVRGLDELTPEEFTERWHEGRELIRENGVTYNVYGDPRGLNRPWELDPIPLLISAEESE